MKKHLARFSFLIAVVMLAALMSPARPAHAAAFVVDTLADNTSFNGLCSLREAILAANYNAANSDCGPNSAADDTITFSVSGVIRLASALPAIVAGQGALTINGGGEITISGDSNNDNTGDVQVFNINSGAIVTLQNLSVERGWASLGGAISNNGGLIAIHDSTFWNNHSNSGGAIYNQNFGTMTIANTSFSGNHANQYGGVISNQSGSVSISSCILNSNSAEFWGGGVINYDTFRSDSSHFFNNYASISGGGVYNAGGFTVANSGFFYNGSDYGGGVVNIGTGTFSAVNSTFSENVAAIDGGGLYNQAIARFYNATLTRNLAEVDKIGSAGQGGGVWNSGTLEFRNTILAGNFAYRYLASSDVWIKLLDECSGSITNLGHSLMQGYSTSYCTVVASAPVMGDPMLGMLVKTAGVTYIYPLLPGSPAIDGGNPVGCMNLDGQPLTRDQRGYVRPFDGDGNGSILCDIGAFEYVQMLWLPLLRR